MNEIEVSGARKNELGMSKNLEREVEQESRGENPSSASPQEGAPIDVD